MLLDEGARVTTCCGGLPCGELEPTSILQWFELRLLEGKERADSNVANANPHNQAAHTCPYLLTELLVNVTFVATVMRVVVDVVGDLRRTDW